jgi:hypothetical protein
MLNRGERRWWRGWLSHCGTSRKVAGSIPHGAIGMFHSGRTVTLGLTQPLIKISKGKGKAITLEALTSCEGSRRLRQSAYEGGKPYSPAAFTPRKYSWYSFLLEAESSPGP